MGTKQHGYARGCALGCARGCALGYAHENLSGHAGTYAERFLAGEGPYDLWDVYDVVRCWQGTHRSRSRSLAFEKALDKVLSRIHREGSRAVIFQTRPEVYGYARSIRLSASKDVARHLLVECAHIEAQFPGGRSRVSGDSVLIEMPSFSSESAVAGQESELFGWLTARLGADVSTLLRRVHAEGASIAEISRLDGVPEGTLRSRLARAEQLARDLYTREEGLRPAAARERGRCEVLLHNDDENEFATVLEALQRHAELDFDAAEITTMAAHYEGRAVVCRADYARAQGIVEGLSAAGLRATISYN